MKRYWKLLLLAGSILLGFGIFYGYQAVSATQGPQIALENIEGNQEEVENLTFDATLIYQNIYESLTYHAGETRSEDDFSYLEKLDGKNYLDNKILEYQENYRSFMRGKSPVLSNFVETDMYLIYADTSYQNLIDDLIDEREFLVERLNKETGETKEWSLSLPIENPRGYFSITHIFMKDETIQFLANQESMQEDAIQDDFVVYEFDLETEELSFSRSISPATNHANDLVTYLNFFPEMSLSNNRRFIAFRTSVAERYTGMPVSEEETMEIFVYDFEEETLSSFIPEETVPSSAEVVTKENRLYFYTLEGNLIKIHEYNMESGTFTNTWTLDAGEYVQALANGYSIMIDDENRMYAMSRFKTSENDAYLLVFDLDTQERIYAGEVTLEDEPQAMYEVYLNDPRLP